MRGGVIILIVSLLVIYMGVTGKYCCFSQFTGCVMNTSPNPCECGGATGLSPGAEGPIAMRLPKLPTLPSLPSLLPISTLG